MIRHICMFRLKEQAEGKNREENLKEALSRLEGMRSLPAIRRFEVVTNNPDAPESNYDLSLIFDFDSMEDLNKYQKDPLHVEFGTFIAAVREARACIDYEL